MLRKLSGNVLNHFVARPQRQNQIRDLKLKLSQAQRENQDLKEKL